MKHNRIMKDWLLNLLTVSSILCLMSPLKTHFSFNFSVCFKKKPDSKVGIRFLNKVAATYSPTVTQYHRRWRA